MPNYGNITVAYVSFQSKINLQRKRDSVAKVCCIVLNTDLTLERDFFLLRNQFKVEFDMYVNRIQFKNPITENNLKDLVHQLGQAVNDTIFEEPLDAIVFNCTSASALLGENVIKESISREGVPILTTASSCISEIKKQGIKNLDLLCPYPKKVSELLADYFINQGLRINHLHYLDVADDRDIARINHSQIIDAAKRSISGDSDGLFLSCTALRSAEIVSEIEKATGKKVFTSNYSTFHHLLSVLNIKTS